MKLVFCGTPDFAVPSLQAVVDAGHEVALVLTQPDRPAGRKLEMQVPPVKRLALGLGLEVIQPERIKSNDLLRMQLKANPPDAIVVVAYGRIIPGWMLELPQLGCINVHGSLLPKYRGAAPIQWALANGETETGVTTMRLDAGLDTGDTLLMHRLSINPDTTFSEVYPQLSQIGAQLLASTLEGLAEGTLVAKKQDDSQATLAPILTREDGRLDLVNRTARVTYNRWRGFSPWPGAYGEFRGKRFLVHRMHPVALGAAAVELAGLSLDPGELDGSSGELLVGAAGGTGLVLDEVQMEGKPRLAGGAFAREFQVRKGERLG
jgi:methionyl-tRNA formyltransferase